MASKNYSANLKIGAVMGSSVGRVFGNVNKRIKEQEATLKKLRASYKQASKGTGEYAGKLDQLQREIDQTEAKLKRMKAAANFNLGSVGSTMAGDFKRLAKGAGIAAGAVAAVGASVFYVTKGFVDWADDIGDSAEALGMSTQALQTWQFAAATVGVGGAKMTASIARFSKAIAEGGKATEETIDKLGVNAARLQQLSLDEQLEVIAEAFKDYKGTDKAAIAMRLFGKSGYQLAGILSRGKKGLDEFRKAGEETGAVLDDEAAEAAGKAASALDMMGITLLGLRNTIAIQFVPALTRLVDKFSTFVRENGPQIREWASRFGVLLETKVVPALGDLLVKLPGIVDGLASFGGKVYEIADGLQEFLGGWDNLAIALVALNFAPTIAAIGKLASALWTLSGASWAATGPMGLLVAAIGGISLALFSIVDPGGPLDILGRMFPETMEKVRNAAQAVGEWMEDKIDSLIAKLKELIGWFDKLTGLGVGDFFSGGFGGPASTGKPDYALPRTNYSGILGVVPKGDRPPIPGLDEKTPAPSATKDDILEHLKPQSNNTYNINVNAPGADGADIAERIRRAFERQPLFDSDGALVPG
jgi:hypothetical protein